MGGDPEARAKRMVRRHLASRDISDMRVLAAMAHVPRHVFVPDHLQARAYEDGPLPIGFNQTISQPYIVALMTQSARLDRHSRVLEIGTGSGYQTAVLATIAEHVWTMERIPDLSTRARGTLDGLGVRNVDFILGDGAAGYETAAPYDAILVAAAAPSPPQALLDQLADGGRLVVPVGDLDLQTLTVCERDRDGVRQHSEGHCRFVPLVSPAAFRGPA